MIDMTDELQPLLDQLQLEDAPAGGALVVYQRGNCVATLSYGMAQAHTSWSADTLSLNYSTGKGVLATLVHILVSAGQLNYDQPIADLWPEFANNGKRHITLREVLTHQAGLFDVSSLVEDGLDLLSWEQMLQRVANMAVAAPIELSSAANRRWRESHTLPHSELAHELLESSQTKTSIDHLHKPHYQSVYSALVYGWVIGGLIEVAVGDSLPKVLEQYLTGPLGIADACYFGIPKKELHRVAKLPKDFVVTEDKSHHQRSANTSANADERKSSTRGKVDSEQTQQFYRHLPFYPCWQARASQLQSGLADPPSTAQINRLYFDPRLMDLGAYKSALSPPTKAPVNYHDDTILQACIPAANTVSSANALATIYTMLAQRGVWQGQTLIDAHTFAELSRIHVTAMDGVMPAVMPDSMQWRLGYHRVISACHDASQAFGHMGYNGSVAWCDPSRELSVAYVHNHDVTMFTDVRQFILTEAVLALADKNANH